jgi:hypothetical protein
VRRLVAAAAALTLAHSFGGGAAGAAKLLDTRRLTKEVAVAVRSAQPDLPVTAVRCPKRIRRKADTTTFCVATAGGLSLLMRVTLTDDKGGVAITSTQAVIAKAKAEEFVAANATLPAQVDCGPDPYIVRAPGSPFVCSARFDDGTTQQVTLSPVDVAGTVTITQVA